MTYSLAVTGLRADSPSTLKTTTLSDANARNGSQEAAMRLGTAFLCQGPDGFQAMYTIDASRSVPGGPIYLLKAGP